MSRWIGNNLGLMALAVTLAFVVWMFNTLQVDPIVEQEVEARVALAAPEQLDLVLSNSAPNTVTVKVRAPSSVFRQLSQRASVSVDLNLSKFDAGDHVVQLRPVLGIEPAQIVSSQPVTASIKIERVLQRTFPVRASKTGTPALGYQAQEARVDVASAVITGTEAFLSKIVSVDAVVSLDDVRSSVQQQVRLVARDRDGGVVQGARITPAVGAVTVPVVQLSNYRTLAVSVRTRGLPAEGYAVTSINSEPQVVTVFGNKDEVQKLPGFIETLEVNVDSATESINEKVGLRVPTGVTLVGDEFSVRVSVRVEAQQGTRTIVRRPTVIGNDSGLPTIITPETVEVRLSGPLPALNSIKDEDVKVLIDLSTLAAGVHQVRATVVKPDALTAQLTVPTIQVELREISTPSPSLP